MAAPALTATPKRFWESYSLLIIGAVIAHMWLIFIGLNGQGTPMGDLLFAYHPWIEWMLKTHQLFGLNVDWVYPYPAQIPMWIAKLIDHKDFQAGWLIMITVLDVLVLSLLVNFGRRDENSRINYIAGWYWVMFLVLLGPVSISRIDAVSCVVALIALMQMTRRHLNASTSWLSFATWLKVWPVALVASAVAGSRHWLRVIATAVATSAGIILIGFLIGGNLHMFSFLSAQQTRGLQLEAPISSWFLWASKLGFNDSVSYYDQQMLTFQVAGTGTSTVAALMGIALAAAFAITLILTWLAQRAGRHYSEIMPIATLTAVLDLIVFNKVGSPQYATWLAIPIILGVLYRAERWRTPMISVAVIAFLTQMIYPTFYGSILRNEGSGLALLLARNLCYVLLLVYANVRLSSLAMKSKAGQPHLVR